MAYDVSCDWSQWNVLINLRPVKQVWLRLSNRNEEKHPPFYSILLSVCVLHGQVKPFSQATAIFFV
jgi:hypothetical protein